MTLIGTGGTGKTRLMLEVAGRVADGFVDGTWLAELAPLGDPAQVASEIARALGAPEIPGQPALATVQAFLADKELLLLLDNAEHLVDAVAGIAERLLATASRLRILTTSREALAISGEAVVHLQSLSCPVLPGAARTRGESEPVDLDAAARTEAVRLFLDRATSVDPAFALDQANVASVSEICRRLDGIPLAIELAAARVSVMSPDDIAKRLGDRFRLLAGGRRTAVPRQQTLHALIDWSWDLLTDDDRRLLRRLSIFAGGWTARAAARVVGDDADEADEVELLDRLTRLVDRSMVIVDRGPSTRFRMLETIRQYAREKLIEAGEVERLADRHFATFAALAAAAGTELYGPAMVDWLDRMDADIENLDAALEWGLESAPWQAVRMAAAMNAYWGVRVASEDSDGRLVAAIDIGRKRTIGSPDAPPEDQAIVAHLLGDAARIWAMSGRAQIAIGWARDAVPLAVASGDVRALLRAQAGLAIATVFTGGDANLRELFQEGVRLSQVTEDWWMLGMAAGFAGAGIAAFDLEAGEELVRQGEAAAQRTGNPYVIGAVSIAHGRVLGRTGRTDAAAERFAAAVARFRGDRGRATQPGRAQRPGSRPASGRPAGRGGDGVSRHDRRVGCGSAIAVRWPTSSRTWRSSPSTGASRSVPPGFWARPRPSGKRRMLRWPWRRARSTPSSSSACTGCSSRSRSRPNGRPVARCPRPRRSRSLSRPEVRRLRRAGGGGLPRSPRWRAAGGRSRPGSCRPRRMPRGSGTRARARRSIATTPRAVSQPSVTSPRPIMNAASA